MIRLPVLIDTVFLFENFEMRLKMPVFMKIEGIAKRKINSTVKLKSDKLLRDIHKDDFM